MLEQVRELMAYPDTLSEQVFGLAVGTFIAWVVWMSVPR